jgi:hypothetical protein
VREGKKMRFTSRLAGTTVAFLLTVGTATASRFRPQDYPDMGNVRPGCGGASYCIIYVPGGGTATLADVQNDLRVLTSGLPPGVGVVAYLPTEAHNVSGKNERLYSDSDIGQIKEDAQYYSQQFGTDLSTVCVSDGVRAVRDALPSYSNVVGPLFQIDQLSPFPLKLMPRLDTTKEYVDVISYWAKWGLLVQGAFQTGPDPFVPGYSIIVGKGSQNPLDLSRTNLHGQAIGEGLRETHDALLHVVKHDLVGLQALLQFQSEQGLSRLFDSGSPGVPSQEGPGAPSHGGGLGVESFPAWLSRKGGPHVPPPHF